MASACHYEVLVNRAIDHPLTYEHDGAPLKRGDWVLVPVGKSESLGLVVGQAVPDPDLAVKPIKAKADMPPLSPAMLSFLDKMADYTLANRGLILRMVLAGAKAAAELKPSQWLLRSEILPAKLTAARERVLAAFQTYPAWQMGPLLQEAGVSRSVVQTLLREGVLTAELRELEPPEKPDPDYCVRELSDHQKSAAAQLTESQQAGYVCTLLDGVTGSGKTEVYFEVIADILRSGRGQVLILMPEIALTESFIERFRARFGTAPGVWHSGTTALARGLLYRDVMRGEAKIVLGARSALFLPFKQLCTIIVDEEHDQSYKSEDRVIHNARDMAVLRAASEKIAVVLCSATPSLETYYNVQSGRYQKVALAERFAAQAMPSLELIDLRDESLSPDHWLSDTLKGAVTECLSSKRQALLFLNRRGYAPLTLCRACGFRFNCPTCTAWLVEHRTHHRLTCHHCGYQQKRPDACPSCAEDTLIAYGPGVERIAEEAREAFPDARVMMLSSDLKANTNSLRHHFAQIERGEVDIIVGTQLIAKGHHFPRLGLVGVVDGDLGLAQADLRAAERSFQLLTQVIGRAGREGVPGRGMIQSLAPEHPVLQSFLSGDRDLFYQRELAERQRFGWPPQGRLAALIVSSMDVEAAGRAARKLAQTFPAGQGAALLGPVEAPMFRLRGQYRFRLLVKASREIALPSLIRAWLKGTAPSNPKVRTQVDIDPMSFV